MTYYILLISFLLIGFLAGYFNRMPETGRRKMVLSASILLLLFSMGVSIGKTADIGEKLVRFGYSALTIALLSIIGSVLAIWLMTRLFRRGA